MVIKNTGFGIHNKAFEKSENIIINTPDIEYCKSMNVGKGCKHFEKCSHNCCYDFIQK